MFTSEKMFGYVVMFLGVALLMCVAGIIYLVATDNTVPDILQNIASGIVAGLIGLLATPNKAE